MLIAPLLALTLAQTNVTVQIDATATHQSMEGFGSTTISLAYGPNDNVPAALRTPALSAAFDQIQLTMGNLEVEPSEAPASNVFAPTNDDNDPMTYNAAGFNWQQSDNMFQKVVSFGRARGFTRFWLGPLISTGYALGFVNQYKFTDYNRYLDELAEHVLAVMNHWKTAYGIDQPYVQLFNEPTSGNGELTSGTQADLVAIVKRCGARLRAAGFATKFIVPAQETEAISLADATAILADPDARQYVGAIAYHPYPYGSTYAAVGNILSSSGSGTPVASKVMVRHQLRDLGRQYSVPVFMVEVSHSEVPFTDFDNVRGRAIHIHDELEYADAAAFFGMNMFWDTLSQSQHYQGRPDPGFWQETDSMVLIDDDAGTVTISPMGRAVGHFARFVKRGALRVETTTSDPLVLTSAFRDDARGRQTVVAINNATAARTLELTFGGVRLTGAVTGEQSNATAPWVALPSSALTAADRFSATVPARSVTTFSIAIEGADAGQPDAGFPVPDAGGTGGGTAATGGGAAGGGGGGAGGGGGGGGDQSMVGGGAEPGVGGGTTAPALDAGIGGGRADLGGGCGCNSAPLGLWLLGAFAAFAVRRRR